MIGAGAGDGGFDTGVLGSNYFGDNAVIRSGGGDNGFGGNLSANTVYFMLGQYSDTTTNAWVFTLAGYDAWVAGGASVGALTANAFSSGSRAGDAQFVGGVVLGGYLVGVGTVATIDEVRFDSTLAGVTPIPEPSAFAALAGLAVLGLAASRRRRA